MIGVGMMGSHHARAYYHNPNTAIVAAADPDEANLKRFTDIYGVPGYADYNEMLAKENLDIAGPVLPVRENVNAIVASAEAGVKAIFCDKPLTASLADADRAVEACAANNVIFYGGHSFRNHTQFWEAREMIEAGEIGEVQSINLYDANGQGGCHSISVMRMFAGDADVDWIVGWVQGDPNSDWEGDEYTVERGDIGVQGVGGHIRFANGIDCYSHHSTTKNGIEVIGSRGTFVSDSYEFHLYKAAEDADVRFLKDQHEVEGLFEDTATSEKTGRYDDEGWLIPETRLHNNIKWMVESLEFGTPPRCSGEDLRKALEIVIAMRESHRRGHAPIRLPLEDRSLKLYPVTGRWDNKKDYMDHDQYESIMASRKSSAG